MFGFIFIIFVGILMLAVFIRKIIINISNRKKSKIKYTSILTDLYTKLKLKSAEDILLKKDFVVKNKYYKLIQPGKYVTEHIENLAGEILDYLNLKHKIDVVVLYDENNRYESNEKKAGYYRSNRIKRDIHIVVKKDYNCRDVAAVLCHEISHLYMELMGIEYEDKTQNEEATDVVAIMLGFGKIMIDGYVEHQYERNTGGGYVKIYKSKIGYISCDDCKIVYSLVKKMKKNVIAEKKEEVIVSEAKKKAIEKLELAKDLYDRFLDAAPDNTTGAVSGADIAKLQEFFLKIENGYFSSQFERLHGKLAKELTRGEVEEIVKEIDSLCYEITMHSSLLAKS